MKPPRPANSPIDKARRRTWLSALAGYLVPVDAAAIEAWLRQFAPEHRDLAARVLDAILFIPQGEMAARLRDGLQALPGWSDDPAARAGKWRFAALSSSAGESGDAMLHLLRRAAGLSPAKNSSLFIYRSDIPQERFTSQDTLVFVDDFSGTGDQAVRAWQRSIVELLPTEPRLFLVLVAANDQAISRIQTETPLTVVAGTSLHPSANVFSPQCHHFEQMEKQILLGYCNVADHNHPQGYGDCGNLIAFPHGVPNNSIPILRAANKRWVPLLRRPA